MEAQLDGDRATTHVGRAEPARDGITQAHELTFERVVRVEVGREGLLVANGLQRSIGLDRAIVEAVRQLVEVAPVRLAEHPDERRLGQCGEVSHGRDAEPAEPFQRRGPDSPERLHGMALQELELVLRGHDDHSGAGPDARGAHLRLRGLGRKLRHQLRARDADRAGEAEPFAHLGPDLGGDLASGAEPAARSVTSRKASSNAIGSTSGVTAWKICCTSALVSE